MVGVLRVARSWPLARRAALQAGTVLYRQHSLGVTDGTRTHLSEGQNLASRLLRSSATVRPEGFAPPTNRLSSDRSAVELRAGNEWGRRSDSNRRPLEY